MSEPIALLTNKTFLMHKVSEKWEKFIDITKYPQLGGEPEKIDVTRLTDTKKRYINGLEDSSSLTFDANYTKEGYTKVNALDTAESLETFRLCFGDELGTDGCFEWEGRVSVYIAEGESNGARKMHITISDEGEEAIHEVDPLTAEQINTAAAAAASVEEEPGTGDEPGTGE